MRYALCAELQPYLISSRINLLSVQDQSEYVKEVLSNGDDDYERVHQLWRL